MADPRNILKSKFEPKNRFPNFGNLVMQIHVQGFRCHANTIVDIKSPITAFCGQNGTGKSTLIQLASVGYKTPDNAVSQHYYISDFMTIGALDPAPFAPDASVKYTYWNQERKSTSKSIKRRGSSWDGYDNRQERSVFFTGVGYYLPKIEQKDFIVQHASHLEIINKHLVDEDVRRWTSTILSCNYEEIITSIVNYTEGTSEERGEVLSASRYGVTYSESHMGYGEARTLYLVSSLEKLPPRSLILIEEPETSLHSSAQHQLGKYLVDVVNRKNHQIFLTTHSMFLLSALPSTSIIYLKRVDQGILPVYDLSSIEINSLLADGHVKALHILVEDLCASVILRAIFRRIDRDFLRSVEIHYVQPDAVKRTDGGEGPITKIVKSLKETRIPIACVLDGDVRNPDTTNNIFKLPGNMPPEKEIFASKVVAGHLHKAYEVRLDDFMAAVQEEDHHQWPNKLANYLNVNSEGLLSELANVYAQGLLESELKALIGQLKEAAHI